MSEQSSGAPPTRVVVLGDGVGALMSTLALCDAGMAVDLLSTMSARRWHGPHGRAGLNAVDPDADAADDSLEEHVRETLAAGRDLGRRPLVAAMAAAAPAIVAQLSGLGVPFDRRPDGPLARRRLAGSKRQRAVFAGERTAEQILYALDDHVRRLEHSRLAAASGEARPDEQQVRRFEHWELVSLVLDDEGRSCGCVAQHLRSMQLRAFPAAATVLATGSPRMLFEAPTVGPSPDHAVAVAYRQGAVVANIECVAKVLTDLAGRTGPRIERQIVGGLWVDGHCDEEGQLASDSPRNHSTNLAGLYAVGGACHAYHGASPLAGNELLASLFGATLVAVAVRAYCRGNNASTDDVRQDACDRAVARAEEAYQALLEEGDAPGSAHELHAQLARAMCEACDLERTEGRLAAVAEEILELQAKTRRLQAQDKSTRVNQEAVSRRHLESMLTLAQAVIASARRGSDGQGGTITLARCGEDGEAELIDSFEYRNGTETVTVDSLVVGDDSAGTPPAGGAPAKAGAEKDHGTDRADEPTARQEKDAALPKTVRLRIRRQDAPDRSETRRWEDFEVPATRGMTIATALLAIRARPKTSDGKSVAPVVWEGCCLEGVCGGCAMLVNGFVRLACTTLVSEVLVRHRPITLEPLSKFPVVRDLVVSRSRLVEDLVRLRAWPDAPAKPAEPRPLIVSQEQQQALALCNHCGACLEACPEYREQRPFVGAAALSRVRLLSMQAAVPGRCDELSDALMGRGGIADCGKALNCVEVCPNEIPLEESLGAMARATTKRLLAPWQRKKSAHRGT